MLLQNMKKRIIVLLVSLFFYLFLAYCINTYWNLIEHNKERVVVTRQRDAYSFIRLSKEPIEKIVKIINELPEWSQNYIDYYNYKAWQDPQQILFMHKCGIFYCVTFGDGSQSILKYWIVPDSLQEVKYFQVYQLGGGFFRFTNWSRVVVFGALGILITIIVSSLLLKNKKRVHVTQTR